MKIRIVIKRLGGGYLKAIFGQNRDPLMNEWHVDSVFGRDEDELLLRLKARLPAIKTQNLRRMVC